MSILPDHWIRDRALKHGMIEPFEDRLERNGVISYGLSSYGYDARVADEFKSAGKGELFEALKGYLTGDAGNYADAGATLKMNAGAVRVAVHRMRARYRDALCEEIVGTVEDPAEVEAEIGELLAALQGGR